LYQSERYSVAGSGQPVTGFFFAKDRLIADTKSMSIFNRSVFGPGFFFRVRFRAFAIDYAALSGST
jgi:hypothetical protein